MGWNLLPQLYISQESSTSNSLRKAADLELSSPARSSIDEVSTNSSSSSVPPCRLEELKLELRTLLSQNGGLTKDPQVVAVVDELVKINPCIDDCARNSELFLGEFIALSCPNFPGRIKSKPGQEHIAQYTLGRMSFNIFQPAKLACTVRSIRNPVIKQGTTKCGQEKFSYPLAVDITIHTEYGDLPAILINEAECYEHTDINNRLMVSFTGGTLLPSPELRNDEAKLALWSKTFEGAYEQADKERSYMGWVLQFLLKIVMGLSYPSDESLAKHSFHFDMKRSPIGYLDVLYLDEDIRITKGNRGTIVVAERTLI